MPISQSNKINIGITAGDAAGVGPEILLKALAKIKEKNVSFLIIGDHSVLKKIKDRLSRKRIKVPHLNIIRNIKNLTLLDSKINLLDLSIIGRRKYKMGKPQKICGYSSVEYIKKAVDLAGAGLIDALVTAPINKEALHLAGYRWPGHTELLAHLTKTDEFAMMFVAEHLKIILATTHIPIEKISTKLNSKDIFKKIRLTQESLKKYFHINRPLIGIAGLNPHASDGGTFGDEEEKIILPAVRKAKRDKINIVGPESAESLFYKMYHKKIDAVICMYHDQGLIPLKMILRDKAVNLTLGLPFIRTSCSSGTAYDISDKLIASPLSMIEAIKLAVHLTRVKTG